MRKEEEVFGTPIRIYSQNWKPEVIHPPFFRSSVVRFYSNHSKVKCRASGMTQCIQESCRTAPIEVRTEMKPPASIQEQCKTLTQDCCPLDDRVSTGCNGLYNNLIYEQKPGRSVWHYFDKVLLIG
jgi:hypothetical protein